VNIQIDVSKFVISPNRKRKIDDALLKMVVFRKESFSVVDNEKFIKFCKSMNDTYNLPCRGTLCSRISTEYDIALTKISNIMKAVDGKIALTGDGWSSRLNRSYFVLTAHWLQNWNLKSVILEFIHFPPPHDTENTVELILN
jgi:hypothetical protein